MIEQRLRTTASLVMPLTMLLWLVVVADSASALDHSVGIQGGFSTSTMIPDPNSYDYRYTPGWEVGLNYELAFQPWFSLRSELELARRGLGSYSVGRNAQGTITLEIEDFIHIAYVGIPVIAAFRMSIGERSWFTLHTGLRVDFTTELYEREFARQLRDADLGAILGIAVGIADPAGNLHQLILRYNHGLLDMSTGPGPLALRNRSFDILLASSFFRF